MGTAKPVSLSVKPFQVSHLCFEVDGILEVSNVQLGAEIAAQPQPGAIAAFGFPAFYAILGSVPTVPGDPSLLLYNFLEIDAAVAPFALVALRKEARKAALNKAINARQNAYFAKYANQTAIINQITKYYSPSVVDSKPYRLQVLSGIANDQYSLLKGAYSSDGRTGVVKTTKSVLNSSTTTSEQSSGTSSGQSSDTSSGQSTETGQSNEEEAGYSYISGNIPNPPPQGQSWGTLHPNELAGVNLEAGTSEQASISSGSETSASSGSETSQSSGSAIGVQTIVNTDYGYRTPFYESAAQLERAQISLMDQQFAQFMYGQNIPNLGQVFRNELNSIDSDVFRLQIAYLNTILMSPIQGTVTGIYKNPGDAVRAGEPVLRVENNSIIYLMATVIYTGPIVVGSTVTVSTSLFDSSPLVPPLTGSVVSVRGRLEDDKWDLVVKCNNPLDSSGNPILPLNYHFDYDNTQVSIT
jgi:biotin carboxyl carrier protein